MFKQMNETTSSVISTVKEHADLPEEPCVKGPTEKIPYDDPFREVGPCDSCPPKLTKETVLSLVIKCANFVAEKHKHQRRKDLEETPYVNHLIGVAYILVEEGNVCDPAVILAALLHDSVEDTDTTFDEIEQNFGYTISQLVQEVTDDKRLPKQMRKRLQIENAHFRSHRARLVILADKLYNLRDLQKQRPIGWTTERVKEYFKWAKAVIDQIRGTNFPLERELDIVFAKHVKDIKEMCRCAKHDKGVCSNTERCKCSDEISIWKGNDECDCVEDDTKEISHTCVFNDTLNIETTSNCITKV